MRLRKSRCLTKRAMRRTLPKSSQKMRNNRGGKGSWRWWKMIRLRKRFSLCNSIVLNIIAIFPVSYNMYLGWEICCPKQCLVFLVCWLQNSDFFNKLLQAPSPWHEVTHRIAFCNWKLDEEQVKANLINWVGPRNAEMIFAGRLVTRIFQWRRRMFLQH